MIDNELKRCPFCGGCARDRHKDKGAYLDVYIQCRACKAKSGAVRGDLETSYRDLRAAAVKKWNDRVEVRDGSQA